jgi:hypothetical protein
MVKTKARKSPAKKPQTELAKAKKKIVELEKDIKETVQDANLLIEEAFITGYAEALIDADKKADAMEKYLEKAMKGFEQEYGKKLKKTPIKKTVKKKKKVTKKKKTVKKAK